MCNNHENVLQVAFHFRNGSLKKKWMDSRNGHSQTKFPLSNKFHAMTYCLAAFIVVFVCVFMGEWEGAIEAISRDAESHFSSNV